MSSGNRKLRLLSLDGGGARGLSSIIILQRLMEIIDPENPPRPCDYFDMIGGTSTGGLIAIMLGRLRMTTQECRIAYEEIMPSVFTKRQHRSTLTGQLQGRFDSDALEKAIRTLLRNNGIMEEELLKSTESTCKTFVCATSKQTRRTVVLSSYYSSRRGTDLLNVCKIWEAARATSAATTFFEGITIDKEDFVDGATGANNPLHELWTEANDTWRVADGPWRLEDNVACVVSIGTGSPSIRLFKDDVIGISGTLRDIATNCERAAEDFQRHHQELKGRFFRFNVQGGLGDIGLERVDKVKDIIAATRGYLEPEAVRELIEQCGLLLKESPWTSRITEMFEHVPSPPDLQVSTPSIGDPISLDSLSWFIHTDVCDRWVQRCERGKSRATAKDVWPVVWHPLPPGNSNSANIATRLPSLLRREYPGLFSNIHVANNEIGDSLLNVIERIVAQLVSEKSNGRNQASRQKIEKLVKLQRPYEILREIAALRLSAYPEKWTDGLFMSKYGPEAIADFLLAVLETGPWDGKLIIINNIESLSLASVERFILIVRSLVVRLKEAINLPQTRLLITLRDIPGSGVRDALSRIPCIEESTEQQECLESLGFIGKWHRYNDIQPAASGTTEWIWSHLSYRRWERDGGILWICGKAGSGKSVLAKSILDRLDSIEKVSDHDNDTQRVDFLASSWFYSRRGGSTGTSHAFMLRSILADLLRKRPSLFYHFRHLYRVERRLETFHQDGWRVAILEDTFRTLASSWSINPSPVCIVDGFDESDEGSEYFDAHRQTLRLLSDVALNENSKIRIIVLSRPTRVIEEELDGFHRIVLERENEADIVTITEAGLRELKDAIKNRSDQAQDSTTDVGHQMDSRRPGKRRQKETRKISQATNPQFDKFLDQTLDGLRTYILTHSQGVMLWLKLIMAELRRHVKQGADIDDLMNVLSRLPSDLLELYQHVIHNIKGDLAKTRRVLSWIVGVSNVRPIQIGELFDAMKLPEDLDVLEALKSPHDPLFSSQILTCTWFDFYLMLYDYCGCLVEVLPPHRATKKADSVLEENVNSEWRVQLIHKTVIDFLQDHRLSGSLHVEREEALLTTLQLLVRYVRIYLPFGRVQYAPQPVLQNGEPDFNSHAIVDYLNDRYLLTLFIDFLPFIPEEVHDSCLLYKDIFNGNSDATPLWFMWSPEITEDVIRISCEKGCLTTTRILTLLFDHNRSLWDAEQARLLRSMLRLAARYGFIDWVDFLLQSYINKFDRLDMAVIDLVSKSLEEGGDEKLVPFLSWYRGMNRGDPTTKSPLSNERNALHLFESSYLVYTQTLPATSSEGRHPEHRETEKCIARFLILLGNKGGVLNSWEHYRDIDVVDLSITARQRNRDAPLNWLFALQQSGLTSAFPPDCEGFVPRKSFF